MGLIFLHCFRRVDVSSMLLMFVYRELLGQNPENVRRLMQLTVTNELSPTRSPNNMLLLTVVFQQTPELAAKVRLPLVVID